MKKGLILFIFLFSFNSLNASCDFDSIALFKQSDIDLLKADIHKTLKAAGITHFNLIAGSSQHKLLDLSYGEGNADIKYDLASITKVFTAITLMKILKEKAIDESELVANILPEYKTPKKDHITIEDLLRHRSGFKAGVGLNDWGQVASIQSYWQNILNINPTKKYHDFLYSDLNYLYIGKIIEKLSGRSLKENLTSYITNPLKLANTNYLPIDNNCAPTINLDTRLCRVHDPTSFRLGELTGHAGIFSNLNDMTKLALTLLNNGHYCGQELIKKSLLKEMTSLKTYSDRGLGFDIQSPYARRPRGEYMHKGKSFGHTGFTGTSMWIDPSSDFFVLILSNAVYAKNPAYSKKLYLDLLLRISTKLGKMRLEALKH